MSARRRELTVLVHPNRPFRIYDPKSKHAVKIWGRVYLEGYIQTIEGVRWLRFPTQRQYGIPLINKRSTVERIELDLKDAKYFGDVTVLPRKAQEERHAAE